MNLPDIPTGEQREKFKERVDSIGKHINMKLPDIFIEMELRLALIAYHGSVPRLCWYMLREWFEYWAGWHLQSVAMWISDTVGWTKLYDVPETTEYRAHKIRHGYKCHGSPNCHNDHCISDCLPKWFKWITRHPEIK